MRIQKFSAIALVMLLPLSIFAQDKGIKLSGHVYDIESLAPISGVNIIVGGSHSGTATNSEGYFNIKVEKIPLLLHFSCMGYESNQIEVSSPEANPVKVYMKPEIRKIGEVTIPGEKIMNLIKGDTLNIVDYEISDNQIIMVANLNKHLDDQRLYLTTPTGEILSSLKINDAGAMVDIPESIDYWTRVYLYKDCFKSIQLLTKTKVYQIFNKDNNLKLIYPTFLEDFQSSLMPAKAMLDGHLFTQKTTRLINNTYVIAEGDTLPKLIKTVSDPYGDFRYVRPIDFPDRLHPASWFLMRKGSYERCVTAPVIQRKNDILIFDFFGNSIDFFSADGDKLRTVPIKFHLMEYLDLFVIKQTDIDMINFSQKILYDERTDRIWAVWHLKSTGRYYLKEVNPENGEIVRVVEVPDYPFVDKIQIHNNIVYFLYTEKVYPYYRSLYRMGI